MAKTIGVVLSLKDKCTPAITRIAQKFGMTETEAKRLNAELKKQAQILDGKLKGAWQAGCAAIGAVAGATAVFVNQTSKAGDRVDKMSQQIGMGRKAFQEWDYIMTQNGGNVESLQMGYKTLASQMDNARKGSKDSIGYFSKLGISIKDSSGQLRSQDEVFNEAVSKLQNMNNATEKAIIAQKLFGKAAIGMKPLLNQNAESIDNLRQKANDLGLIMSDESVDAAVKFTDTMDTVKRSFGAIGITIGTALLPHIQGLADQLINHLPQIKSALIPTITGFSDAIGFVCNHLDIIVPAVGALAGAFAALNVITSITTFIGAFCNPVGLAVVGITALIAGVGAAYAKFEGFRNMIGAVVAIVKMLAVGIWNILQPVSKAATIFMEWCTPLGYALKLVKALCGGINQLAQAHGGWRNIGNNIKDWADDKTEKMQHHALGTSFAQGGNTLVGEYGPEIVNLPRGAKVLNASQTASNLGGNNSISVTLNVNGNVLGNKEFIDEILQYMGIELRKVMPA